MVQDSEQRMVRDNSEQRELNRADADAQERADNVRNPSFTQGYKRTFMRNVGRNMLRSQQEGMRATANASAASTSGAKRIVKRMPSRSFGRN